MPPPPQAQGHLSDSDEGWNGVKILTSALVTSFLISFPGTWRALHGVISEDIFINR